MNCPKCGEQVRKGAAFCGKCGKEFNSVNKYIKIIFGIFIVIVAFLINILPYKWSPIRGLDYYIAVYGPVIWLILMVLYQKFFKPGRGFAVLAVAILVPFCFFGCIRIQSQSGGEILISSALALITVFLFFLTSKIKKKVIRTIMRSILIVAFIPIFALFCYVIFPVLLPGYHPIPFEKNKWAELGWNRYVMVHDIIGRNILIGKTKEEVTELLGKGTDNYPLTSEKSEWYYYVEKPSMWRENPTFFIEFKNGRVVEAWHTF